MTLSGTGFRGWFMVVGFWSPPPVMAWVPQYPWFFSQQNMLLQVASAPGPQCACFLRKKGSSKEQEGLSRGKDTDTGHHS